jgi:hypothetical protein
VSRVRACVGLMLRVIRFTCFCGNIMLLSAVWMLKCFLLVCDIMIIYRLKYRTAEVKEYLVHLFVFCVQKM